MTINVNCSKLITTLAVSLLFSLSSIYARDTTSVCDVAGDIARVNIKANALAVLGVVNPAIEVRVCKWGSVQLEGLGVFYPRNFLGTGYPLMLGSAFGEFRYYPKEVFIGFYVGANIGYGVYRLNKNIYPFRWGTEFSYQKNPKSIMTGQNLMAGLSLGYVFTFKRNIHWSIELSWGLTCASRYFKNISRRINVISIIPWLGI